jgi:hypothetical protein
MRGGYNVATQNWEGNNISDSWVSLPHGFFLGGLRFASSSGPIFLEILVVGLARAGLGSEMGCLVRALIVETEWGRIGRSEA